MDKYILFRFVPTMGCNYRCSYCFVSNKEKGRSETMFRLYTPQAWIKAMDLWRDYDVEFYMWGGEPFSIRGTYEIVKGWTEHEHVICCSRIDTNMSFVDRIIELCPTEKVKLNCSWHREYESLDSFYDKICRLKEYDMVGMANFVINDRNIRYLREEYGKSVSELVQMFDDIDVFMNIAGDFSIFEGKNFLQRRKYKKIISQFTSPEDWKQLRCEKGPCECKASQHFFTVHQNGDITTCLNKEVVGNFFEGTLRVEGKIFCEKKCPSLIAYPFRLDNNLPYRNNLMAYVKRNRLYRQEMQYR